MELALTGNHDLLARLSDGRTQSPEDFLIYLEESLESGELTLDEVIILIHDYKHR